MSENRTKHFPFSYFNFNYDLKESYFKVFNITVHNNIRFNFSKVFRTIYIQFSLEFQFFFQNQNRTT